jgi:photosystem II stability/assembly factor-like uncharacterized protein
MPRLPAISLGSGGPFADLSTRATALAVDPAHPLRVYLGTSRGLFVSTDGGVHWPDATTGVFADRGVRMLAASPQLGGLLWLVAGDGSLWASPDGGESWRPAGFVAPSLAPSATPGAGGASGALPGPAAWVQPGAASTSQAFAYVMGRGLYGTADSGMTWRALTLPAQAGTPNTLLAGGSRDQNLLLGAQKGLYRSTDGGAHWSQMSGLAGAVLALAGAPAPSSVVYCVTDQALYHSSDGGASFKALDAGQRLTLLAGGAGPSTLYGVQGLRVVRSDNGGQDWALVTPAPNAIAGMAVGPGAGGDPQRDTVYVALSSPAGLLVSQDGGRTWQQEGG